jgi:hypothetical protein
MARRGRDEFGRGAASAPEKKRAEGEICVAFFWRRGNKEAWQQKQKQKENPAQPL